MVSFLLSSDGGADCTGGSSLFALTSGINSIMCHFRHGTHSDSYGPRGQTTIARKVVVDQAAGGFIHDYHGQMHDYITLEPQSLAAIRFRVTDWKGETVEMSHWSLSILILPEENF